jgi:hypothetical protein
MNIKLLLTGLFLILSTITSTKAGIRAGKIQLNPETALTLSTGIVIPKAVIDAEVGQFISIYLMDGTCYKGEITEVQAKDDVLKVYGKSTSHEEVYFGFAINSKGTFGGAIVDKKNHKTYGLEFSPEVKGYVFLFTNKYNKDAGI